MCTYIELSELFTVSVESCRCSSVASVLAVLALSFGFAAHFLSGSVSAVSLLR